MKSNRVTHFYKMKNLTLIWIVLIPILHLAAADMTPKFQLVIPSPEWNLPKEGLTVPLLILWEVKNRSDHRLVLPIGSTTKLEFLDINGTMVPGGESSDGLVPYSYQDYRPIMPEWSTYISVGDLSLYWDAKKLFIGGHSTRGGWIRYGPFTPGKYKLTTIFSTAGDPSTYAKKTWAEKELWLGKYKSEPVEIEIK
jgi:hypothetical protein